MQTDLTRTPGLFDWNGLIRAHRQKSDCHRRRVVRRAVDLRLVLVRDLVDLRADDLRAVDVLLVFLRVVAFFLAPLRALVDRVDFLAVERAVVRFFFVAFFFAPARVLVDLRAVDFLAAVFFFTVFFLAPVRDFVDLVAVVLRAVFLRVVFFLAPLRDFVAPLRDFVDLLAVFLRVVPVRDVPELRVFLAVVRVAISLGSCEYSFGCLFAQRPHYPGTRLGAATFLRRILFGILDQYGPGESFAVLDSVSRSYSEFGFHRQAEILTGQALGVMRKNLSAKPVADGIIG